MTSPWQQRRCKGSSAQVMRRAALLTSNPIFYQPYFRLGALTAGYRSLVLLDMGPRAHVHLGFALQCVIDEAAIKV